jgi:hypothetical protein
LWSIFGIADVDGLYPSFPSDHACPIFFAKKNVVAYHAEIRHLVIADADKYQAIINLARVRAGYGRTD